ncbi:MAG TPA: Maf family protein [Aldersonia sp.]
MTRLVLASASPARLSVLRGAGLDPLVQVSDVDEDAVVAALPADTPPETVVVELARAKARAVTDRLTGVEDPVIVGCDSMLLHNGALQGKPGTPQVAIQRWAAMAGTSAHLLTGHCLIRPWVGEAAACSTTTVHFANPTDAEIAAYVATGEPLAVAGSFTLDGLGGWFVDRIEGDPSSVIGIGLPLLRRLLREVGIGVTDLWVGR